MVDPVAYIDSELECLKAGVTSTEGRKSLLKKAIHYKYLEKFMKVFAVIALMLTSLLAIAEESVWLDVRSAQEFGSGHVPVALNIPHTDVAEKAPALIPNKDTKVYVYCRSGRRADVALKALQAQGYTNVHNVGGLEEAEELYDTQRPR
jgi:phage shock protein E